MIEQKRTGQTGDDEAVAERGVASMARARSLQSRLSGVLAMVLCGGLAVGLLAWYYGGVLTRHRAAPSNRHSPALPQTTDSSLPPLGPIRQPALPSPSLPAPVVASSAPESLLPAMPSSVALTPAGSGPTDTPSVPAAPQTAPDRRLAGPTFAGASGVATGPEPGTPPAQSADPRSTMDPSPNY